MGGVMILDMEATMITAEELAQLPCRRTLRPFATDLLDAVNAIEVRVTSEQVDRNPNRNTRRNGAKGSAYATDEKGDYKATQKTVFVAATDTDELNYSFSDRTFSRRQDAEAYIQEVRRTILTNLLLGFASPWPTWAQQVITKIDPNQQTAGEWE